MGELQRLRDALSEIERASRCVLLHHEDRCADISDLAREGLGLGPKVKCATCDGYWFDSVEFHEWNSHECPNDAPPSATVPTVRSAQDGGQR